MYNTYVDRASESNVWSRLQCKYHHLHFYIERLLKLYKNYEMAESLMNKNHNQYVQCPLKVSLTKSMLGLNIILRNL
jgi:hypothetical protein